MDHQPETPRPERSVRTRIGDWMLYHPWQFSALVGLAMGLVNGVAVYGGGEGMGSAVTAVLVVGAGVALIWRLIWQRASGAARSAAAQRSRGHDDPEPRP